MRCSEHGDVVLTVQDGGVAVGGIVGELLGDLGVVGILILVLDQVLADFLVDGEGLEDVLQHLGVVGAGGGQQPGAAPEVNRTTREKAISTRRLRHRRTNKIMGID